MSFKYTSKYCLMGMMSNRFTVLGDWQGFQKNKNTCVSFDTNFVPDAKKVNFSYIYEKPDFKCAKSTQVVSVFDNEFFELRGKKFREIRETRNKFDKVTGVTDECDKHDVLDLIDTWDERSGQKYGWYRHSGYDRTFFNRWYDVERENLLSRFFYIEDKLIGYSILHKADDCYEYLIRKMDNTLRDTCLYVDYKTFEEIYKVENKKFYVNWGASSGGVARYKKKFPVHEQSDVYFYTVSSEK